MRTTRGNGHQLLPVRQGSMGVKLSLKKEKKGLWNQGLFFISISTSKSLRRLDREAMIFFILK